MQRPSPKAGFPIPPPGYMACSAALAAPPGKIIVLGAGVAGLVAATRLRAEGHDVVVLEASHRIGGRVWTRRFEHEGRVYHGEMGAMRIPASHHRVLGLIHELGLAPCLRPFLSVFQTQGGLLDCAGARFNLGHPVPATVHMPEWPAFSGLAPATAAFLRELCVLVSVMAPKEVRQLAFGMMDPGFLVALDQHLVRSAAPLPGPAGVLAVLLALEGRVNRAFHLFLSDIMLKATEPLYQLAGVADQLNDAMAARCDAEIRLGAEALAIDVQPDSAVVTVQEGGRRQRYAADRVVCTIPLPVLRRMSVTGLDATTRAKIARTNYATATKVVLFCAARPWEAEGIKGGASFSDRLLGQVYYPHNQDFAGPEGVLLASYCIGEDARRIAALAPEERLAAVTREASRLHPALAAPGMVLGGDSIDWSAHPWTLSACSTDWDPEMHDTVAEAGALPAGPDAWRCGGLVLAGEHCSRAKAWIEGAVTSAEAAVAMVQERPILA